MVRVGEHLVLLGGLVGVMVRQAPWPPQNQIILMSAAGVPSVLGVVERLLQREQPIDGALDEQRRDVDVRREEIRAAGGQQCLLARREDAHERAGMIPR